ncbi:tetratricopeptide repeat protein [Polynucleobacter sp. IMCC 29146]|uniref:tetratricopeptide repeat protein n=1 Tax=Polynucleobacter sp. IMCC 29146 TaxID=2780953 RepID=UPI001F1E7162|nr:tetratricopeptide repeat protein [Polynucleobacter sp. IMCC 29146]MCE7530067.1 tetratricopeptide repeat protein [Polynucleobacter sp. IMCC 29146]
MKKGLIVLCFFWLFSGVAFAADSPPVKFDPVWLINVRIAVKAGQYDDAIKQLQAANDPASADWNNLMGYSLRKKTPPDLVGAEKFYQAALAIDPTHRGALEYYGKLMLLNKNLTGAEGLLARLDKACTFGCEEYSDLKEAVASYKKAQK